MSQRSCIIAVTLAGNYSHGFAIPPEPPFSQKIETWNVGINFT